MKLKRNQVLVIMNKRNIFLTAALSLSLGLFAQHNEDVTVEGVYRPKVNKVDKIRLTPEKPQLTFEMPSSEVHPKVTDRHFDIELEKLSPSAYSEKEGSAIKPVENFLMAGMGTRLSPLFLYRHDSRLTKNVNFGVGLSHFSSWINMKDRPNSSLMNNLFDVRVASKLSGHQLDGKVYYKNDLYHYYGYNLSDSLIPSARVEEFCPKQVYNLVGARFAISSTDSRLQTLQHSISVGYDYAFSRFGLSEHNVALKGALSYADNWWGDRKYPQRIGMDLEVEFDDFSDANLPQVENVGSRLLVGANPYFEMKGGFYKLHLGARVDYTSADSVRVGLRPDLKGSLFVFDGKLEFFAGLGGGREMVAFKEVVEENPFVGNRIPMRYRDVRLSFEAGLKTAVADKVDLMAAVRYRNVANDYFFVMDELSPAGIYNVFNQYTLLFDKTDCISVMAEARCRVLDGLNAEIGLSYNGCTPETEERAWYRPAFEGRMKVAYELDEELSFDVSLSYQGGRYAKEYEGYGIYHAKKLKDIVDVALGANYKLNDQLSVFAKLDNVANCRYQMFYGYPVTGIQLFAGVKMRF